ncbi:MAG: hypothetical protein ACLUEQ_11485 [Cloacibacillus evryensis]
MGAVGEAASRAADGVDLVRTCRLAPRASRDGQALPRIGGTAAQTRGTRRLRRYHEH